MDIKKGVTFGLSAVALLVGVLAGIISNEPSQAPPVTSSQVVEQPPAGGMVIHVAGWVIEPGVVQVPEGSLLVDVIEAAGGARPGARLDLINLASPVATGDRVEVPGPHSQSPENEAGSITTSAGLIDLNKADVATLQSLPGVGPVLAQRIVDHRQARGAFTAVEDLLDVSGIGEAKLAAIRDLVVVR